MSPTFKQGCVFLMKVITFRTIQIITVYRTQQVTDKTCPFLVTHVFVALASFNVKYLSKYTYYLFPQQNLVLGLSMCIGLLHACPTWVSVSLLDEVFPPFPFLKDTLWVRILLYSYLSVLLKYNKYLFQWTQGWKRK